MKKKLALFLATMVLVMYLPFGVLAEEKLLLDGATLCTYGDSITALGSWPKQLAAKLNMKLINAGIGGNTTTDALKRFVRDVEKKQPDFVIIGFGTNDFVRESMNKSRLSITKYHANLVSMVEKVRALSAEPVFITAPYLEESVYASPAYYAAEGGVLAVLDLYNEEMRKVAVEQGVGLIDIRKECEAYSKTVFLRSDGVHLADKGNQVYADTITAYMQATYRQDPNAERVPQPTKPTIPTGVATLSLISMEPADWFSPNDIEMEFTKNTNGSLEIANTTGAWPEAHYIPDEGGISVPVKGTTLTYDFSTANVATNIILYFNGSTPTTSEPNEELSLNPFFTGANLETVGDISAKQQLSGTLELSKLSIPPACIDAAGNVQISGVKVFVAGNAYQPVTLNKLEVTTDGSAPPPTTKSAVDTSATTQKKAGMDLMTSVLIIVAAVVVMGGVVAFVALKPAKK